MKFVLMALTATQADAQFQIGGFKDWMRDSVESEGDSTVALSDVESFCLSDYSVTDENGNNCQWYDTNFLECGLFDTDLFVSRDICCMCQDRWAVFTQDRPEDC